MRMIFLLALLLAAGCASTQDTSGKGEWKVIALDGYELQADTAHGIVKVDTITGNSHVLIFERTVGRIEVDAGYTERLWIQTDTTSGQFNFPGSSAGYYERICRCEQVGFHRITAGRLNYLKDQSKLSGKIRLEEFELQW